MKFSYKARTREGKIQKGTIEASSRKAALDILEKYGLFVTSLEEEKRGIFAKEISLGKRISLKDVVIFTRQFGAMLKAAVPPFKALKAQVAQTSNPQFRERILKMAEAVETGSSLSQAFALYPDIFDSFYISIIKSGEAAGKVADSLNYLADHLEKEYNLRQKVKGAMMYPAFVVLVFIAAFFLVTFFIVPNLTEVLKSFKGELPLPTKIIIKLADFVRKGGWIAIFGGIFALGLFPKILQKTKGGKELYHKISLKVPILGDYLKKIYLARFSENLSVLIKAGLPITQALKISQDIVTNTVYKNILQKTQERVARGEKISAVFQGFPEQIPAFVTQMIATGEETGKLDATLMEIVNFYRQEIERTTDNLTSILEPILILILGGGIAVLAISIFIPLFKIGLSGMTGM